MDRAFNDINIEVAFIDNNGEILGQSTKADKFAEELRNEK